MEVSTPQRVRLGRNDPCHCGSGRKYKNCHLDPDEAAERDQRAKRAVAAREEKLGKGFPDEVEHYHPLTRKIPAAERQDFRILVQRLSQTGTPMLVHTPQDLAREHAGLAEALRFCADRGVSVEFGSDPPLAMVAGLQAVVDGMYGRAVYQLRQSGLRLHGYGRSSQGKEDGKAVFYLALPTRSAVRAVLFGTANAEAAAEGILPSPSRSVMVSARVLRHLTVHFLDLPEWAQHNIRMLLDVVVDRVTDEAQIEDETVPEREVTTVLGSLPFALALPEAVDSPASALEGMGLSEEAATTIVPHLEHIRDSLPWIRRAGEATVDGWETPEGFAAWQQALSGIPEMGTFLDFSTGRETAESETSSHEAASSPDAGLEHLPPRSQSSAIGTPPVASVLVEDAAASQGELVGIAREPTPQELPPVPDDPELFSEIQRLREDYADQRSEVAANRVETERERDRAEMERAEVVEHERQIGVTIEGLALRLAGLDDALARLGDEERAARMQTLARILEHGARRLRDASATWEDRRAQAVDISVVQLEKAISEHEEMARSGLLAQLPALARQREEEAVAEARAALRERYGGLDPLVMPVAVLGAGDESEPVMILALPLRGDAATLAPESVGVAVATAACDGVKEALDAMEISVLGVSHIDAGTCAILRYHLHAPEATTLAETLDMVGMGAESAADRSPTLRQARIGLRSLALPDVDEEELATALLSTAAEDGI